MNLKLCLVGLLSLAIMSFSLEAQDLEESEAVGSVESPTSSKPYEISFIITDSTDITKIDSIITKLDSILTPRSDIYGHNLLLGEKFALQNASDVAQVGSHYVIGVGDEITLSIFGAAQFDSRFVVNDEGYIAPANMPKIFLKGVPWGKAQDLIRNRFKQFFLFRDDQFAASLSRPRDITIHVIGEVSKPGSYRVNAIHTVLQALTLAGGVTDVGSVRMINLVDGDGSKILDIYNLLDNPKGLIDLNLTEGMIIQVPVAEKIVEANGMKREMKFELLPNEDINHLINYAGGFRADAVKDFAQITRFMGAGKEVIDIDLSDRSISGLNKLLDGDIVNVRVIEVELRNTVSARGAIDFPGTYSLENTPNLSDLISKVQLKGTANLEESFLIRKNPDATSIIKQISLSNILENPTADIGLQALDELVVDTLSNILEDAVIKVSGAVQREVEYPFSIDSSLTIHKAILLAGGLQRNADDEGYIIRKDIENNEEIEYIPIDVRTAYTNSMSSANLLLSPNDELLILDQEDYTDERYIFINGAVRNPDSLQYSTSLSVSDVLKLSGGLSSTASGIIDVYRIEQIDGQPVRTVSRTLEVDSDYQLVDKTSFVLQAEDELVARRREEYGRQVLVSISGAIKYEGTYAVTQRNESIVDLIQKAGGLTDEAFSSGIYLERGDSEDETSLRQVVVDGVSRSIVLQAGDHIVVPKKSNTVSIYLDHTQAFSEQTSLIEVPFTYGADAKWYLDQYAGGLSHKSDRSKIAVRFANGAVRSARKKLFRYDYPIVESGATIVVKKDLVTKRMEENQGDYPKLRRGVIINVGEDHDSEARNVLRQQTETEESDNE